MPYAEFTYMVIGKRVVEPTERPGRGGHRELQPARPLGVHPAVQRGETAARVRAPRAHRAPRSRARPARRPARPPDRSHHARYGAAAAARRRRRDAYHRCSNPSIRACSPRSSDSTAPAGPRLHLADPRHARGPAGANGALDARPRRRGAQKHSSKSSPPAAARRQGGSPSSAATCRHARRAAAATRARCAGSRRSRARCDRRRWRCRPRCRSSRARPPRRARAPRRDAAAGGAGARALPSRRLRRAPFEHGERRAGGAELAGDADDIAGASRRRGRRGAGSRAPSRWPSRQTISAGAAVTSPPAITVPVSAASSRGGAHELERAVPRRSPPGMPSNRYASPGSAPIAAMIRERSGERPPADLSRARPAVGEPEVDSLHHRVHRRHAQLARAHDRGVVADASHEPSRPTPGGRTPRAPRLSPRSGRARRWPGPPQRCR